MQDKFLEYSREFRKRLKKKGISFKEFLKRAEKIREEIAEEMFSNDLTKNKLERK